MTMSVDDTKLFTAAKMVNEYEKPREDYVWITDWTIKYSKEIQQCNS